MQFYCACLDVHVLLPYCALFIRSCRRFGPSLCLFDILLTITADNFSPHIRLTFRIFSTYSRTSAPTRTPFPMTSPVATLGSPQLGRPSFPYMGPLLSNITALPPYISEALKATFPATRATFFQVKFLSGGSELVRCMPSMAHDPQYLMLCAPALKAAVDG